jgi:hypothetical protein
MTSCTVESARLKRQVARLPGQAQQRVEGAEHLVSWLGAAWAAGEHLPHKRADDVDVLARERTRQGVQLLAGLKLTLVGFGVVGA